MSKTRKNTINSFSLAIIFFHLFIWINCMNLCTLTRNLVTLSRLFYLSDSEKSLLEYSYSQLKIPQINSKRLKLAWVYFSWLPFKETKSTKFQIFILIWIIFGIKKAIWDENSFKHSHTLIIQTKNCIFASINTTNKNIENDLILLPCAFSSYNFQFIHHFYLFILFFDKKKQNLYTRYFAFPFC